MFRTTSVMIAIAAVAAPALGHHHHLTVDTVSGQPGDKVLIVAGYYPEESTVSIDTTGRVLDGDGPLTIRAPDRLPQAGLYNNWFAGDQLALTSDYFVDTGRLDGGDFRYQLVSVSAAPGAVSSPTSALAWGDFSGTTFVPSALSTAGTQAGGSFEVGVGSHDHAQGCALQAPGVYDVTLVAWDANGRYAPSDPVAIRITTTCAADFNAGGSITVQDIFDFLGSWFSGDDEADVNESGDVTVQDIFDFLALWFGRCG